MPVYKFRSIEEMDAYTWRTPGDPELYRAIRLTWDLARRANPKRFPPGVRRFRSIEAMNQANDDRLREHIRRRERAPDDGTGPDR